MGGGVVLVVAGVGLWHSGSGSVSGAGNALLTIEPASQNVAIDAGPFVLTVKVSNVENG